MTFTASTSTITASIALLLATISFTPHHDHFVAVATAQTTGMTNHSNTIGSDDTRYIVKFKYGTLASGAGSPSSGGSYRLQKDDPRLIMVLPDDDAEVMTIDTEEDLLHWQNHEDVEYVERDSKVYPHQLLSPSSLGESTPWGIERVRALDVSDDDVYNQKVCM